MCSRVWNVLHFVLSCEAFIKDDGDDGGGWLDNFITRLKRSPSVAAASRPAIMCSTVVTSVVSMCSLCSVRDEPSVKCEYGRSLTDLPNGHASWEHLFSPDHCRSTKNRVHATYWVVRARTSPAFSASWGSPVVNSCFEYGQVKSVTITTQHPHRQKFCTFSYATCFGRVLGHPQALIN